jgi:hypothetical protein
VAGLAAGDEVAVGDREPAGEQERRENGPFHLTDGSTYGGMEPWKAGGF